MNLELLSECDRVLNACGRPALPQGGGVGYVDIPYGIQYQKFQVGAAIQTTNVNVDTPVPFVFKSFQAFVPDGITGTVNWRLRLPNGRFLQSSTTPGGLSRGSFRYVMQSPLECSPKTFFQITFDSVTGAVSDAAALSVLLEGALRFPVRGAECAPGAVDSIPPRYTIDRRQNILAPEWRLGNQCYVETPDGYQDEVFTFCTPLSNLVTVPVSGDIVANVPFGLDPTCDFVARFFQPVINSTSDGGSGTLAVQVRDDAGYSYTDGFLPITQIYTVFPEWWIRSQGRKATLYIDYQAVDTSGTGNLFVQTLFGGVKRRRVA
jgi:hypothetical protein